MNERHCRWQRLESALHFGRAALLRSKAAARQSHLRMLPSTPVLPAA